MPDEAQALNERGLLTGSGGFYPLSHVPPRAGFIFAMTARFREASGYALSTDEALKLAQSTYHFLLPQCGGYHGNPAYDWSIAAAIEWADSDIEHWEQRP